MELLGDLPLQGEPQPSRHCAAGDVGPIVVDGHPFDARLFEGQGGQRLAGLGDVAVAGVVDVQPVADLDGVGGAAPVQPDVANVRTVEKNAAVQVATGTPLLLPGRDPLPSLFRADRLVIRPGKPGVVYYDGQFDDARLAVTLAPKTGSSSGVSRRSTSRWVWVRSGSRSMARASLTWA